VGENWASVGDAFGFVDPMLSPGILLALKSSELLHQRCQFNNLKESLKSYSTEMVTNLNAWRYLIDFFYSGRIFELYDQGLDFQRKFQNLPIGFIDAFMTTNLASMASGFTTTSRFAQGILGFAERYMLENRATTSEYAIA
jgi:flavin-dependent dehydrogenase